MQCRAELVHALTSPLSAPRCAHMPSCLCLPTCTLHHSASCLPSPSPSAVAASARLLSFLFIVSASALVRAPMANWWRNIKWALAVNPAITFSTAMIVVGMALPVAKYLQGGREEQAAKKYDLFRSAHEGGGRAQRRGVRDANKAGMAAPSLRCARSPPVASFSPASAHPHPPSCVCLCSLLCSAH